jgi:holliday junction DNA helicase RuvA
MSFYDAHYTTGFAGISSEFVFSCPPACGWPYEIIARMIVTLTGTVAEKLLDEIVLDVGGVGYGLFVTPEDYGRLGQGQRAKVYVHEHIRETAHDLFGFSALDTKQLFEQLLGVNGVGPKMALSVLSIGSATQVRAAIAGGDTKFIQRASGVGKRVAERIVVELKDKLGLAGVELGAAGLLQSNNLLMQDEAIEALASLGYTLQDAVKALKNVDNTLSTEERIKIALKGGAA